MSIPTLTTTSTKLTLNASSSSPTENTNNGIYKSVLDIMGSRVAKGKKTDSAKIPDLPFRYTTTII